MTDLQKIKKIAKENGLEFKRTNSAFAGATIYNFVHEKTGIIVARNWTVASAMDEYNYGDLVAKIS